MSEQRRGYFAIGAVGISKTGNIGSLLRSAHAFGASFFFSIKTAADLEEFHTDTSDAEEHVPFYNFDSLDDMILPKGCVKVGIELVDDSVELPSFRHPQRAIYLLGPERGSLPDDVLAQCDHVIKIPTKFCINVGLAGALVMYDRLISMGRFAPRPVKPGGPTEFLPEHVRGAQIIRSGK